MGGWNNILGGIGQYGAVPDSYMDQFREAERQHREQQARRLEEARAQLQARLFGVNEDGHSYSYQVQYVNGDWALASPEAHERQASKTARERAAHFRKLRLARMEELKRERRELREEGSVINNFLIGCDPEFAVIDAAGNLTRVDNRFEHKAEIGYDHGGKVVEIHPEAARGSYGLLKKIAAILQKPALQRINGKFRAGAYYEPNDHNPGSITFGGHVHLGVNPWGPIEGTFSPEHHRRIAALDDVTRVLEGLDILPGVESKNRRDNGHYGAYGQIRTPRNSDGRTFRVEYRTMPSWLVDPKVAYLCLTAAKLAAADPEGTTETLARQRSWEKLVAWFERYKTKDSNARRALEKVMNRGLRPLQIDPTTDFREKWLGLTI